MQKGKEKQKRNEEEKNKLEVINNTLKIKDYTIKNLGVRMYIEDMDKIQEIAKKYNYKFFNEMYKNIFNFASGEQITLFNTENEQLNNELNSLLISICTKINRDYNRYKIKKIIRNIKNRRGENNGK